MKRKLALISISIVLVLLVLCGKSDQTYTIEIKDSVKYINNHSPLWGDTTKVYLEFVQQIGVLEGKDENYWLYVPRDIFVDSLENIYVLDTGNSRIQKYDKNGKFLISFGRYGQGPGEFNYSTISLNFDAQNYLLISEYPSPSIQKFSSIGKFLEKIPLEVKIGESTRILRSSDILIKTHTDITVRDLISGQKKPHEIPLLSVLSQDGKIKRGVGTIENTDNILKLFATFNFSFTADPNDFIYITYDKINCIEKYTPDGTLLFKIIKPLNYEFNFPDDDKINKKVRLEDIWTQCNRELRNTAYISKGIAVDMNDRIWVVSYTKAIKSGFKPEDPENPDIFKFDIFSNEGFFLGSIPMNIYCDYIRIFDDKLYVIDERNQMCVYEYKIVEKF